jgi:hypothetical protein
VASAITVLVVLAAYGGVPSDGVWRIGFGVGIIVSTATWQMLNQAPSRRLRLPTPNDEFEAVR